jgi:hypothetical protein
MLLAPIEPATPALAPTAVLLTVVVAPTAVPLILFLAPKMSLTIIHPRPLAVIANVQLAVRSIVMVAPVVA